MSSVGDYGIGLGNFLSSPVMAVYEFWFKYMKVCNAPSIMFFRLMHFRHCVFESQVGGKCRSLR